MEIYDTREGAPQETQIDTVQRTSYDLDSIEIGTPGTHGKLKVYFNTEVHTFEEIQRRIDLAIRGASYTQQKQQE